MEEREKFRIMNENDKLKQMISFYQNNNDYGIQRLSLETLEILDKNTMQMLEKIKEQKILVKYNLNYPPFFMLIWNRNIYQIMFPITWLDTVQEKQKQKRHFLFQPIMIT